MTQFDDFLNRFFQHRPRLFWLCRWFARSNDSVILNQAGVGQGREGAKTCCFAKNKAALAERRPQPD